MNPPIQLIFILLAFSGANSQCKYIICCVASLFGPRSENLFHGYKLNLHIWFDNDQSHIGEIFIHFHYSSQLWKPIRSKAPKQQQQQQQQQWKNQSG